MCVFNFFTLQTVEKYYIEINKEFTLIWQRQTYSDLPFHRTDKCFSLRGQTVDPNFLWFQNLVDI